MSAPLSFTTTLELLAEVRDLLQRRLEQCEAAVRTYQGKPCLESPLEEWRSAALRTRSQLFALALAVAAYEEEKTR